MKKMIAILILGILVISTSGCIEQKYPHGQQVKPEGK
jgi:hypothetical protein